MAASVPVFLCPRCGAPTRFLNAPHPGSERTLPWESFHDCPRCGWTDRRSRREPPWFA